MNKLKIRRYIELGCEVKALGRGHIKRLKDDVLQKRLVERFIKRCTYYLSSKHLNK